jgi:Mor family transcriptional regulator
MKDMAKKGRSVKGRINPHAPLGEAHGMHVLKDTDVVEIRQRHQTGMTQRALAALYKISFQHVSDIVRRKRWKHI